MGPGSCPTCVVRRRWALYRLGAIRATWSPHHRSGRRSLRRRIGTATGGSCGGWCHLHRMARLLFSHVAPSLSFRHWRGADPALFSRCVLPVGEEPGILARTYQGCSGPPHGWLCVPLHRGLGLVRPAGCPYLCFAAGPGTTIRIIVSSAGHGRVGLDVFGVGLGVFRACRAKAVSIPAVSCLTKRKKCRA